MNANGARFHLLLGRADWGRCTDAASGVALSDAWDGAVPSPQPSALAFWDPSVQELSLAPVAIELPATATESPLTLDARRDAAADRHGNVYRIADDRRALRVMSVGSGQDSEFWPALPSDCSPQREAARLDFLPAEPALPPQAEECLCLAITADDTLVVAYARGAERGLLAFDLVTGGEPVRTVWPLPGFEPFDMAARCGGGVWVLDRKHSMLWELDCTLAAVIFGQAAVPLAPEAQDDFQPLQGAPRLRPSQSFAGGIPLSAWVVQAIAVQPWGEHGVLLLDRDDASQVSRVVRVQRLLPRGPWQADASGPLDELSAPAHDFVLGRAALRQDSAPRTRLFVAPVTGNQVRAYDLQDDAFGFRLQPGTELFPLRRYAGRALITVQQQACYDSGAAAPVWTRIVQQPRARFATEAELVTPAFDSAELGTVWDRLVLDACLPADTVLQVWSRAGDDCVDGSVVGAWVQEPLPLLRATGAELPWLRADAARATRREAGVGSWELLFQQATGRWLQLKLRLQSRNGTASPRLRALRAWAPRFSYPEKLLPGTYREDPAAGNFLERWLANLESSFTQAEDRIVQVQWLFDPRSAPADVLPWLASWFELALDPSWDERRQRLFVRRAMDYFRWRGTVHGLKLALEMAFDPCIDESRFDDPPWIEDGPRSIRIVEAYQTRLVNALAAAAGTSLDGVHVVQAGPRWTPDEGNSGLVQRYAKSIGQAATPAQQVLPFSLVPPADSQAAAQWVGFCEQALGFLPSVGADERRRWQAFLAGRYVTATALNQHHGTAWPNFGAVTLPADADERLAQDWADFCVQAADPWMRGRWSDFLARRYRRIEALRAAHGTAWPGFDLVPLPDVLPATRAGQTDWWQFEGQLLAMHASAHRFSVLLPVASVSAAPYQLDLQLALARRIVELEKPAHTVFDVRFYWAFNRIGEARLGLDTQLGAGSRASELVPDAVLGRAYLGASFVAGAAGSAPGNRLTLTC